MLPGQADKTRIQSSLKSFAYLICLAEPVERKTNGLAGLLRQQLLPDAEDPIDLARRTGPLTAEQRVALAVARAQKFENLVKGTEQTFQPVIIPVDEVDRSSWSRCKVHCFSCTRRFNSFWRGRGFSNPFWRNTIHHISSYFGSSASCFFNFSRWLLIHNVILFSLWLFFIMACFVNLGFESHDIDSLHCVL